MAMQAQIFTFGYGNRTSVQPLMEYIEAHEIRHIVDVREKPKGWSVVWSKPYLEKHLGPHGYRSMPELGNTTKTKDWVPPDQVAADQALQDVAALLAEGNVVLVCAEKDYRVCHRTAVAERLATPARLPVKHLE